MINDYAVAKEKLLSLTDIDAEAVRGMSNKQLLSFAQSLSITAATFPVQKEELEYAFGENSMEMVFQLFMIMSSSLAQVHADALAGECDEFINSNFADGDYSNVRPERVKAFIDYFLPMLSIFYSDVHTVLCELEVDEDETQAEKAPKAPVSYKDKILSIKEINADAVNEMSDMALCIFIQTLNTFTKDFQAQEKGLKNSIKIKHYAFVMQWLTALEQALTKIHATALAATCSKQIEINKDFNNIRHERLEVFIDYFLSSVSMLSEDIKALRLPEKIEPGELHASPAKQLTSDAELLASGANENSKTILIINKMKMFMNSIKNALSESGHKILGVMSAESTVNYLKTAKPDLIILDEDLPQTDVFVLTKIIRVTGQKAPILITTGKITKEKMVKYMEVGVADFIMKPIAPADVQKKIAKLLM
ncbi:MAG: response regulator [Oscillospiraceae bacterium]|nr:response regulator [Oscillospiraceae bacterium]